MPEKNMIQILWYNKDTCVKIENLKILLPHTYLNAMTFLTVDQYMSTLDTS